MEITVSCSQGRQARSSAAPKSAAVNGTWRAHGRESLRKRKLYRFLYRKERVAVKFLGAVSFVDWMMDAGYRMLDRSAVAIFISDAWLYTGKDHQEAQNPAWLRDSLRKVRKATGRLVSSL